MTHADVVVVGGSAAGIVAGISCRRRHPDKKVVLVRKEEQVLVPCGIPYIFGTVGSPEKDLIPDAVLSNNGIELVKDQAIVLDRGNKSVSLQSGEAIRYEKLGLATGSLPMRLPIAGSDKENVFVVSKDVAYLRQMQEQMQDAKD
ncbi:MAG: FAD-dependent oxidoreductase, partial [Chloroflexota bacterium]